MSPGSVRRGSDRARTLAHIAHYRAADLAVILSFLTGAARAAREAL
jgi:hypothetical protein